MGVLEEVIKAQESFRVLSHIFQSPIQAQGDETEVCADR